MLLQQSIEHVSIVYTCNTYFCNALVRVIYLGVSGKCWYTIDVAENHSRLDVLYVLDE